MGFLLAGFTACMFASMFISCAVCRALAPILLREVAMRWALATEALLFLAVAILGFLISM
jgi:hypothetical protein